MYCLQKLFAFSLFYRDPPSVFIETLCSILKPLFYLQRPPISAPLSQDAVGVILKRIVQPSVHVSSCRLHQLVHELH